MSLQDIAHTLVRNLVTQIGQSPNDAIISPTRVLPCQFHDQFFDGRVHSRAASQLALLGTVELLCDELPIPGEDGIRPSDARDFLKGLPPQTLGNLGQHRPLTV
jgi:hypothetical protein